MKSSRSVLSLAIAVPVLLASGSACSGGESAASSTALGSPERDLQDLITALTPPPATEIPVVKSAFYLNRKKMLERLRQASEAHGLEALRVYGESASALPEVRAGLLDVAAHTAPHAAEELLVDLVTKFGADLYVRKEAVLLLGECVPERALVVLDPILHGQVDGRTFPPEDRLLQAWVTASDALHQDPVPLLAYVATDIDRPQDVRHLATRELGRHPTPQGRQALETLLVESSGNGYIRRLALQSLKNCLEKDEFCELARRIQSREADTEFVNVLESAIQRDCR